MANNAKENFNQAMFSMFGVGKDPDAVKTEPTPEVKKSANTAPVEPAKKEAAPMPQVAKSRTVIAEGTVLEGNLKSTGDVEIAGTVNGNVTADGLVIVHSALNGNITAESLKIVSCTVTGDVHVSGQLILDKGSCIVGNVFSKEFICSGEVKGDLNINGILSLKESAKVEGNIVTGGMEMCAGAVFSGNVEMGASKKSK